jgi:hypothetical protein
MKGNILFIIIYILLWNYLFFTRGSNIEIYSIGLLLVGAVYFLALLLQMAIQFVKKNKSGGFHFF